MLSSIARAKNSTHPHSRVNMPPTPVVDTNTSWAVISLMWRRISLCFVNCHGSINTLVLFSFSSVCTIQTPSYILRWHFWPNSWAPAVFFLSLVLSRSICMTVFLVSLLSFTLSARSSTWSSSFISLWWRCDRWSERRRIILLRFDRCLNGAFWAVRGPQWALLCGVSTKTLISFRFSVRLTVISTWIYSQPCISRRCSAFFLACAVSLPFWKWLIAVNSMHTCRRWAKLFAMPAKISCIWPRCSWSSFSRLLSCSIYCSHRESRLARQFWTPLRCSVESYYANLVRRIPTALTSLWVHM